MIKAHSDELQGRKLAEKMIESAEAKKGSGSIVDLRKKNAPADWFVICQGENAVHNRAICDEILDELEKVHVSPWHIEGKSEGRWLLIDCVDVVAHIMLPEMHELYSLEQLWSDEKKPEPEKDVW
ncbi:MAG: ribosome silencing factor [Chitinivibrionales bacterium]|nr:ribosome silencing factor [Chitinivibrionales bacterium]